MTKNNTTFTLGEGDQAEVVGVSTENPTQGHNYWRYEVLVGNDSYGFYASADTIRYNSTIVGPSVVNFGDSDPDSRAMINFKITRAETTPTVTPTSAAASSMLSGWTWMETYPLIFNESSDTWFYMMPVVIDGMATNWLYNYSTEEWTPLATE